MNLRVCIYGGMLEGGQADFIEELAYRLVSSKPLGLPVKIITGGNAAEGSTDRAALKGVRRYARERLKDFFEAWIPDPELEKRDKNGSLRKRMSEEDGVAIPPRKGRTSLGRRLAMVASAHVVVTISGKKNTELVIEQAMDLRVPVLPVPIARRKSAKFLKTHEERIAAGFGEHALDTCLKGIRDNFDSKPSNPKAAANAVVELIKQAKIYKCLVLYPYDEDGLYVDKIEPAVSRHMVPVVLKSIPTSEAIYSTFENAIETARAVIADVTGINANVMYEIGFAHARGLKPLIYRFDEAKLPKYIDIRNVISVERDKIGEKIEEHLKSVKAEIREEATRGERS